MNRGPTEMSAPTNPTVAPEATPEPVWSIGLAAAFVVLWVTLTMVIQISTIAIAASLSAPAGIEVSPEAFKAFFEHFISDVSNNPYSIFALGACTGLTWYMTFGLIEMYFRGVPRAVLGRALALKPAEPRWSAAAAIPIGILTCIAGDLILSFLVADDSTGPFDEMLSSGPGLIGLMAMALIMAPIAEEVFFRGFLFPPLRRALSPVTAILVNGAIFAAAHAMTYRDPAFLVPVMLLGCVAATLRSWTGSVVPGILAHFFFNGTSLALAVLIRGGNGL